MPETTTVTITDFLLARIAEDEAVAAAPWPATRVPFSLRFFSVESDADVADEKFIDRFGPARVLRECAAKRLIIEDHTGDHECPSENSMAGMWPQSPLDADGFPDETVTIECRVVRNLASIYSDHSDYDPAWAV